MTHMSRSGLHVHVRNPDRCGVCEVVLFLASVSLFCLTLGPTNPAGGWSGSWLVDSVLLWLCTSPAWLCRPNREQIKRLFVGGAVAFASIGAAVFVGIALNAQLTHGPF